jgi:4-hydroxybenzoate polyprenyltransferase
MVSPTLSTPAPHPAPAASAPAGRFPVDAGLEPRWSRLALAARDIRLSHTIFALPFALLAAVMTLPPVGALRWPVASALLALVVACMVLARTWAMLVNRLADRRLDALNPRTRSRPFASGRLSPAEGWRLAAASGAGFALAAAGFGALLDNWWPAILSLPVLAFLALYSYAKRFTSLCHLLLGAALAASPLAAAIAVAGPATLLLPHGAALWLLSAMVFAWVAGFDVIYAMQDADFDRAAGLRSIPARLGRRGAAWTSRALHVAAFLILILAWRAGPDFGLIFGAGVLAAGAVLAFQHALLARRGPRGLEGWVFTLSGCVSLAVGAAGIVDVLV